MYYCNGDLTLNANDFIEFKASSEGQSIVNVFGNLTINSNTVILLDEMLAKNIIWNVSGDILIESNSEIYGVFISNGHITIESNINGSFATFGNSDLDISNNLNLYPVMYSFEDTVNICSGYIWNPIYNNLIKNSNFDDTLNLKFTTYLVKQNTWYSSGSYSLITNAYDYNSKFYNINEHTNNGSTHSRFMFVDTFTQHSSANLSKKLIWSQKVSNIYTQLNYKFVLWLTPVNNELSANNTILGIYVNGLCIDTITLHRKIEWREYCADWFSNVDTAKIEIIQISIPGNADDGNFGIDDISFFVNQDCNYAEFEKIGNDTIKNCYGSLGFINQEIISNNCFTRTYEWFPKINLSNYYIPNPVVGNLLGNIPDTTQYILKITQNELIIYDTVVIINLPKLELQNNDIPIELSTNTSETIINPVQVTGAEGNYRYSWEPSLGLSNSNIKNPTITLPPGGPYNYTVTVTSGYCTTTYNQEVFVYPTYSNYNQNACIEKVKYTWNNYSPSTPVTQINNNQIVRGTITIDSGETLIFNNRNIKFGIAGKIIIKRGGHLKLINSILEGINTDSSNNPCYGMWEGIEVWGDESKTHKGTDTTAHGKITISGSSEINDSHIAIYVGRRGAFPNFSTTVAGYGGGIVQSYNTKFRRNAISIEYATYQPTNSESTTSPLTLPTKIISNEFLGGTLKDPGYKTNNTVGASIYPNSQKPYYPLHNQLGRSAKLIKTFGHVNNLELKYNKYDNAQFGVDAQNSTLIIRGNSSSIYNFTNNNIAINIDNILTSYTYNTEVYDYKFNINNYGIRLNNSSSSIISRNVFGNNQQPISSQLDNPIGINLEQSSGFKISDNTFFRCEAGISVYKSGEIGGYIDYETQGNTFERCNYGIVTMDTNSNLQLRCNNFNNNNNSVGEYMQRNWQITGNFINQGNTGNHTQPSGNEFLPTDKNHIYSTTNFQYYRHKWGINGTNDTAVIPRVANGSINFNNQKIIITDYPKTNTSCDEIIPPCTPDCSDLVIGNDNEINSLLMQLNTIENNLDSGNTNNLLTDINATTLNSLQLKNKLIQHSPLSELVLNELINKHQQLTQSHLVEVLEHNLPMSNDIWLNLESKLINFNPAFKSKIQSLQEYNDLSNTPEKTKRIIRNKFSERATLVDRAVKQQIYINKNIAYGLMMKEGKDFQKTGIASMLANKDYQNAAQKLNIIDNIESEWLDFHLLYLNLLESNRNWYSLDSIELVMVRNIASSNSYASSNAKAVLHLLNDEQIERFVDTIYSNNNRIQYKNNRSIDNIKEININIYPVPVKETLSIEYFSDDDLYLEIQNIHSNIIERHKLHKGNDMFNLDVNNYVKGVYVLKFINTKNDKIEFKKFIKQ